jgi:hypothetical protein
MPKDMTARELVRRTLEFDSPLRVPFDRDHGLCEWTMVHMKDAADAMLADFPNDMTWSSAEYTRPLPVVQGNSHERGIYIDDWGCVFENVQDGIFGEVKNPLVETWSDLDKVKPPDARHFLDRDKVNDFCRSTELFTRAGCCARLFERAQFLRGTGNILMDFYESPDDLRALLDIIHRHYLKEVEVWAETEVDAIVFMDDWGTQKSLLIDPVLWRNWVLPYYRDYCAVAKSKNKKVFMHSCGHILQILPDLIAIGVDAVNAQITIMGLDNVEAFSGKLTFWGGLDRQNTLHRGSAEDVRHEVRDVMGRLWKNGGVIAQNYLEPQTNPDNVYVAFDEWLKYPSMSSNSIE